MQREFNISLSQEFYSDVVYISQYDADYNIVFHVKNKYAAASVAGLAAKFTGIRPDGLGFEFTSTGIGSDVTFAIDNTISAVAGTGTGEIVFTDANDMVFGSANVQIIVEPAAHPNDTIDADVEEEQALADEIRGMIDEVEDTVTTVTEAKNTAVAAAGDAEDAKDAAVNAKNDAQTAKTAADADALKAEGYALGKQNGTAVSSGSPYYHNNAAYFADQAGDSATSASGSATAAAANTAPTYSSSATYAVGDYCVYNSQLYKCTTAITTAEAWTAAHWTAVTVGDEISSLKEDLNDIIRIETGANLNDPETQTSGYYIAWSGNLIEAELYDVTDFIPVEAGKSYSVGVYNLSNALYKTRTLYAFYDANKTLVGSVTNTDDTSGLLATAPSGASYIRISGHTHFGNYIYSLMLVESDAILTTFVPYSETKILSESIKVIGLDELEPLIGTFEYKTGKNLYDPSTSVEGFLKSNGTTEPVTGQYYSTSALIPVEPNTNYYVAGFNSSFLPSNTRLIAVCYTDTGNIVSNTYVNENAVSSIVINSQSYHYIRVSANAELANRHLMVTKGSVATQFVEHVSGEYTTLKVESENLPFDPVLVGKKWAVCGDSFTNSGGTGSVIVGGLYSGRPFTYPWIIGNRNKMEIVKFFEGGRTLAFPAIPQTFTNSITCPTSEAYYQNIPADVDYITIYLGINDEHHATGGGDGEDSTGVIPLGTIDDADTSTYYGAWNVVLSWLIVNRPNAHIGIIVTNGLSIEAYRTAQIEIARKYGIPFIDMNGDDRTPAMLRTVNPNIATAVKQALIAKWAVDPTGASGSVNIHPNDDAQLFESYFIEDFLRSI